eukprot:m.35799 g.35799  ORF g.35799 m.35799 type:complete len:156 (+) comp5326_c0_seq2:65-532(+)
MWPPARLTSPLWVCPPYNVNRCGYLHRISNTATAHCRDGGDGRYRDLETEHQLAVTTIAELESQLTGSERQRKKLKKLIASLVESLTDTERTVVENQTELRVLTAEQRSKDKMLKTLLHQLDVSRQDAESTKRGATAMLAEATRIVEDRRGRRHR